MKTGQKTVRYVKVCTAQSAQFMKGTYRQEQGMKRNVPRESKFGSPHCWPTDLL